LSIIWDICFPHWQIFIVSWVFITE
jgi:hypothetical protein